MSTLYKALSICADEVQHYYRAMGGSNQYEGFMNWHIPAFVLLIYQGKMGSECLPYKAWHKTDDIQSLVKSRLEGVEQNKEVLDEFIKSVTSQFPRFKNEKEVSQWLNFIKEFNLAV